MPGTRKLGRTTDHRMAMLKGMVTYLFEVGQIETTYTRAKEVSALAEKMITVGKANDLAAKRKAFAFLKKEEVVYKLFSEIAPLYKDVNGGYTAVYKLGPRRGDGAEMAIIKLLNADSLYKVVEEDAKAAKKAKKEEEKKED
ncbi:MAG: 50S ribosomal protein L17 [Ruminococcaceae bacterium]|nr:50S ribosomal protein L17 [Oscillospiraceae bacterium]